MSEEQSCENLTDKAENNRNKKRPANSPLSDNVDNCVEYSVETSRASRSTSIHGVFNIGTCRDSKLSLNLPVKRKKRKPSLSETLSSETHVPKLNSCYPIVPENMSLNPQTPFSLSQPTFMQSGSPTQFGFPMPPITPPWATEILEEVKNLKAKFKTVENIEKTVNAINSKVSNLEAKYKSLESRVSDTEKACSYQSSAYESAKADMNSAQDELKKLKKKCDTLEANTNYLKQEKDFIESKLDDMEAKSMRGNLLFYGLPEQNTESCIHTIKDLCKNVLEIPNSQDHVIERAQRVGRQTAGKPRPILATYHYLSEREAVRLKSFDKAEDLKKAGYGIGIQLPRSVRDARKPLYEPMRTAKQEGKRVKFVGKKLYINDVLYKPNNDS